ncbi:FLTOP-like protein [Mya arenaria]|uniref:Cilia- and flagella-associated protein 126 n=1 Tax=Mya arenaria TaxID=6604 RepID=A0ABY7E6L8_MYAAR|nr:protein Flattop homolog isoform X2 [Mya arenaria]WAR05505.1 FLTOP-like protein [Mya arenaria]
MSLHFSANQYEKNFKPTLLQNWEVPRAYRERPRAFVGFTQIVASDRGHLLTGVKRSRESPWGTHIGTWDMPIKIPGNNMMNATARTENATLRLERIKSDGDIMLGGKLKQCKVPSPLPVKADKNADKTLSPKAANGATQLSPMGPGSGFRSGAQAPLPISSVDVPASPGIQMPVKPVTPNIDWPRPASQGYRVKSASPNMAAQSPLPAITSPKVLTPPGTPQKDFKWPSPKPAEPLAA